MAEVPTAAQAAGQKAAEVPTPEEAREALGLGGQHPADRPAIGDMTAREVVAALEASGGWSWTGAPNVPAEGEASAEVPPAEGEEKSASTPEEGAGGVEEQSLKATLPSLAQAPATVTPSLENASEEQLRAIWDAHRSTGSARFIA